MDETFELNRLEYMILDTLYENDSKDHFHSMTITDLLDANENTKFGARMTVYKKLRKLVKSGFIAKGVIDNHADSYYLLDKGAKVIEGGYKK